MSDWPYDAPKDDPLTALRLPVVATPYPRWNYLVSVVVDDRPEALWRGVRPNDDEVALLLSELEFERSWYNAAYVAKMAQLPFDVDGGFNSLAFIKRADGDWAYRRRTWEIGPTFRPSTFYKEPSATLLEVLDRVHHDGRDSRWLDWKAGHHELFCPAVKP